MASETGWGSSAVAIIGMAGRFPGAPDIETLWRNLCHGIESISFPDQQALAALGVPRAALDDPHYVRATAVMDGVELFDAAFFGYTPREAELMDPQHRLFLECAYHTLEHAGYDPERYQGAVGVFGGGTTNTYLLYNLLSNQATLGAFDPMQIDVSNASDFVATRVSYKLNLKGPSFTVQTACSTSLVAVHLACQSLLSEECDLALAGGVSVHVKHPEGYWHLDGGNVSPDGHCRPFDASGAGTIFGSGVAAVLLKRLDDAVADGDHIHAVVLGTAINNDGALKVGFTAPSVKGQSDVIGEAMAVADVRADTIRYVETHGTATRMGDPIEIRALTRAFRGDTDATQFCAIGSVKSNLGHLASAAGVTGLIKTALMLERRRIPPSLHFERPNPEIDFAVSPFYVSAGLAEWEAGPAPRRAGVSSFGVGGTNAHAVLQEAPAPWPSSPSRPWQLLLLSAATPDALDALGASLAAHLRARPELSLADVAYTLQVGRQAFGRRRLVVCQEPADAAEALEGAAAERVFSGATHMQDRPVVFLFPGMGDQYSEMALELYQVEPTFRACVDRCAAILSPLLGQDIRVTLYPAGTALRAAQAAPASNGVDLRAMLRRGPEQVARPEQPIDRPALAHPILFTIEYALASLWMEWGVRPQAMIGHSIGEYVAACLAGVFTLEEALTLVARRAMLIEELPSGAMLAVLLSEAELLPRLGAGLHLAAVNSPTACVVSGAPGPVADLERALLADGVACQRVQAGRAFHSRLMEPIVAPLEALLRMISLRAPSIPFYSNLTGGLIADAEATDPAYWARHLCQTVRFADGLQALLDQPGQVLLELGPGLSLTALARQHPAHTPEHVVLASLRQPHQRQSDLATLLRTLGRLWVAGVTIGWAGFYRHERRRRVALPLYPFERRRYWIDPRAAPTAPQPDLARASTVADWFYTPVWERSLPPPPARIELHAERAPWLLLIDAGGLGAALHRRLVELDQPVVAARPGPTFARLADGSYTYDPGRPEDYRALLGDLAERQLLPASVIHCVGVDPLASTGSASERQLQPASERQLIPASDWLLGLAALAQAIDEGGRPAGLWVIGSGAHQVESADGADPARAMAPALCLTIPQEYPQIACRYLDMAPAAPARPESRFRTAPPGTTTDDRPQTTEGHVHNGRRSSVVGRPEPGRDVRSAQLEAQAAQLLAEILAGPEAPAVAYRGGRRWALRYAPLPLADEAEPAYPLRRGGVYLVVDGLLGFGWAMARMLAQDAGARLLLIEPAALPAPAEWAAWLAAHAEDDPTSRKILRAQALEAQGAEVLVVAVDGVDAGQLRAAIDQGAAHFGGLHGAIHTLGGAGADTFLPIPELSAAALAEQLLPAVQRLTALAEALEGYSLDFCLLTSSLSAVLGGLGQTAHAAVSLYMDALAEQQSQAGATPWLSVDWDIWQPEGESAAALPTAALAQYAIAPDQGVEAARRLLGRLPGSRVVVSTADLATRMRQPHGALPTAADASRANGTAARHPRPQLASAYVPPRSELERTIADTWQDVFGLEAIGIDDNFFDLGGNSLIAIHTMGRLKKTLQVAVPTAMLYQRPTIRFLAELLAQDEDQAAQQMAEQLARRKADLGRRSQIIQRRR